MRNIIILFFAILSLQAHEKPKFTSEITNHVRMESPYYFGKRIVKTNYFDDCDACGCSASGGSWGLVSMLNSNFVGVRYFNQQYRSNDGLYSNSPWLENNLIRFKFGHIPIMKGFNFQHYYLIIFIIEIQKWKSRNKWFGRYNSFRITYSLSNT